MEPKRAREAPLRCVLASALGATAIDAAALLPGLLLPVTVGGISLCIKYKRRLREFMHFQDFKKKFLVF